MVWESVEVEARHLEETINHLFEEGNVRRIRLRHAGHILFEIPLHYGLAIGAATLVFAPVLAAVGAVAAVVTHCTVDIEREDPPGGVVPPPAPPVPPPDAR